MSIYRHILGFQLRRRESDYASLCCGAVLLGLGPAARLAVTGGYFTQEKLERDPGIGVEIVFKE